MSQYMVFKYMREKVIKRYITAATHSKFMWRTMRVVWFKKILKRIWLYYHKFRTEKIHQMRVSYLANKVRYYFKRLMMLKYNSNDKRYLTQRICKTLISTLHFQRNLVPVL